MIGAQALKPLGTEQAYVGDRACASCHRSEFDTHARTPHTHTLTVIPKGEVRTEFQHPNQVVDDRNDITYTVKGKEGDNWIVASTHGTTVNAAAHWIFGSGHHAMTYMGRSDTDFIEYRISYYPKMQQWNFTAGRGPANLPSTPIGETYTNQEVAGCFNCHSTVLVGTKDHLDLDRSLLNVGCERCHGPGREHVESAKAAAQAFKAGQRGAAPVKVPLVRPDSLDGPKVMKLCGDCHRLPGALAEGSPQLETQLARFPGIALSRSKCFQASNGKLSCTTCHEPHRTASADPLSYDKTCLSCHTPPQGHPCAEAKTSNCVSCHMPPQLIGRKLGLVFHNHWIRTTIPEEEKARTQVGAADQQRLVDYFRRG